METQVPKDMLLTAADCAARIGISVRALRVYEANGLLSPVRTEKNWRLYGAKDIARLNEIMFLKQLGLSLSTIADLLSGQTTDLERLLEMQHVSLQTRQEQTDRSLRLVARLRGKVGGGEGLTMEDLLDLAKETKMTEVADEHAWKRYEQARPRTEVEADPQNLTDCAGEYVFEDGVVMRIRTADGRLLAEVLGQPEFELHAEAPDRYFLKVTPAQVSFSRGSDGTVAGLVLHQGGYDMPADRCAEGLFDQTRSDLAERVRLKTPMPESEAALRKLIADHRAGAPDFDSMSPLLRALVREQLPMVKAELERLGDVTEISFRGVGAEGFDVYVVDLEHGRLEWGFSKGTDGVLNGLYMRPTP
ncbi:MerR family transcriptional regulator [Roseibium sp.]|uniref:MerR family transcriptional regulator n=1 Tax=Roseibium sp. TaxID=1936156 RepID=UPI003BAFB64A